MLPESKLEQAALWFATGAVVIVLCSNAASQVLLGAAVAALLLAYRGRLSIPQPTRLPLALFIGWTLLAVAFSPDPRSGLPQIKKFYVFLVLPAVWTALRATGGIRQSLLIFQSWGVLAVASGLWGFVQFFRTRSAALASGEDFYTRYVAHRATGFMSHWMTFSAQEMIAGLCLASLLIFGVMQTRKQRGLALAGIIVIGSAILIGWTRSVWLATALASGYLIAVWRPKLLALAPVLLAAVWFASPAPIRARIESIYRPHGTTDSNEHRRVTFRTGLEMIKAHPLLGIGPEQPGRQFLRYLPPDIPQPLPEGFYGHLHNFYLQYAAERGIPALVFLLWLIGRAALDFARALRRLPAEAGNAQRAILHGCIAALIAICAEGFFEHNLGDSEILTIFLTILATGYVAAAASFREAPAHA